MASDALIRDLEEERRRNKLDTIRHARWEAEMVKKLGSKWFEVRDKWLMEAFEADRKMWQNSKVREALIRAILARDREIQ